MVYNANYIITYTAFFFFFFSFFSVMRRSTTCRLYRVVYSQYGATHRCSDVTLNMHWSCVQFISMSCAIFSQSFGGLS